MYSLCEIVGLNDREMAAKALVQFFHAHHKAFDLLQFIIKKEVDNAGTPRFFRRVGF